MLVAFAIVWLAEWFLKKILWPFVTYVLTDLVWPVARLLLKAVGWLIYLSPTIAVTLYLRREQFEQALARPDALRVFLTDMAGGVLAVALLFVLLRRSWLSWPGRLPLEVRNDVGLDSDPQRIKPLLDPPR